MEQVRNSLMRSLERAVQLGSPAQLKIGGMGTVSVYPREHCYVSDIRDWDSAYMAGVDDIRLTPATWGAPPTDAQPLDELRWRTAFHAAQAQAAEGMALTHELVQLVSWPNLTRLPEELLAPVSQVCALLWRKPTVGYLIARITGMPAQRACAVVEMLQMFGHVASRRGVSVLPAGERDAQEPVPAAPSWVARLWQRLLVF